MVNNMANSFTFSGKITNIEKYGDGRMLSIEQDVSGHITTFNLVIPGSAFQGVDSKCIPPLSKEDIVLVENAYCYEMDGERRERIDNIFQIKVLHSMKSALSLGSVEAKDLFTK